MGALTWPGPATQARGESAHRERASSAWYGRCCAEAPGGRYPRSTKRAPGRLLRRRLGEGSSDRGSWSPLSWCAGGRSDHRIPIVATSVAAREVEDAATDDCAGCQAYVTRTVLRRVLYSACIRSSTAALRRTGEGWWESEAQLLPAFRTSVGSDPAGLFQTNFVGADAAGEREREAGRGRHSVTCHADSPRDVAFGGYSGSVTSTAPKPSSGRSTKKISIVMSGSTWAWLRKARTLRPVSSSIFCL
jgi:hypothetical protein